MWRIQFCFRKSNSSLTKLLSLFFATISRSPWIKKAVFNFSMVALDMEEFMGNASIHFGCASTTMRNILQRTPRLTQGLSGHSQGCKDASFGNFLFTWQNSQRRTFISNSESILGHHTWILANDFIQHIPGCVSCNSSTTLSQAFWVLPHDLPVEDTHLECLILLSWWSMVGVLHVCC